MFLPILAVACDHRGGMHTGLVQRGLVKQIDRAGECQVGILAAQHAGRDGREVLGNDHGGGGSGLGGGGVLGIGDEGDLPGAGLFDSGNAGDLGVGVPVFQCGAQRRCDFSKFHKWHISRSQNSPRWLALHPKHRHLARVFGATATAL